MLRSGVSLVVALCSSCLPSAAANRTFAVVVGGRNAHVESMRCSAMPVCTRWPGHQRDLDQTEICSFARFDWTGSVEVVVTPSRPFTNAVVRPVSKNVTVRREGDGVRFALSSVGAYAVEFDGRHENLMLFADPPRDYSEIDRSASDVRYFGPGEHDAGLIVLKANETLFIDEGAVVYGRVEACDAPNIRICGKGILDGSRVKAEPIPLDPKMEAEQRRNGWAITNVKRHNEMSFYCCDNLRLEGITIRDAPLYAVRPVCCDGFVAENVKILGSWRYNADGIDMHNCRHVRIRDSFVRTYDDSICVKGFDYILPEDKMLHKGVLHDVFEDVVVERCTIWNDWGRALEIGAETRAREIRNVTFRDCDILAVHDVVLDVQNCDQAHVHDVVFEDIRVEYDPLAAKTVRSASARDFNPHDLREPAPLAGVIIHYIPEYSKAGAENRGRVSDVAFRDIDVYSPKLPGGFLAGFDPDHRVERVKFDRIRLNGQDVTEQFRSNVRTNDFAALGDGGTVGGRRWYKGMLHSHSYWSDGRGFPEQAARAYFRAGYHFYCLSDHNRLGSDRNYWRDVCEDEGPWPKNVHRPIFESYRREFPDAEVRVVDGKTQVRIKTVAEIKAKFDRPGRFLVLPGMEITRITEEEEWADRSHVHMNYVNLAKPLPSAAVGNLIQDYGHSVSDIVGKTLGEVKALSEELGNPPHLFWVNHPHWRFWDVAPKDVLDHPEIRFFEICNGGSDVPLPHYMSEKAFSCDRFWDVVLAHRCCRNGDLLFGIGTDDAHWYPDSGTEQKSFPFANAYVQVRADALTPEALLTAMDRGDFYASCGVDLEDICADETAGTLSVAVPARRGVAYAIRFVGTKKGFRQGVEGEVLFRGDPKAKGDAYVGSRRIPAYSDTIGVTLKSVRGRPGEGFSASYALGDDDLYVRAVVESSEPVTGYCAKSFQHPRFKTAWTQPVRRKR